MKKIIYLILIFSLSSCSYVNEEQVIDKENITLNSFLGENEKEKIYQNGTIESDLQQIENLEIKLDDIMGTGTTQNSNGNDVSEEDINELIDILFDKN